MEDKIKDIDKALNSLKRDEEQLIKELNKFNGKYEIENGKLTEPREVTEYKRELEKIRAEMEQKNLQRRRYVLLREKARLADENVVKNLKNMYRNEKNADQMINEMIEQRKQDIESKLAEIENTIGPIAETEIESPNIDEVLKTMEERSKENLDTKPVETINLEDLANRFENTAEQSEPDEIKVEEDIQPTEESEEPVQSELEELENEEPIQPEMEENEPENEEETKNTILDYMEQEIEKINVVLKSYENLEKNIDTLVSDFEEEKDKTDNLKSNFGKIKIDIDELSRRKLIAETIKGLVITDLSKAKQEYEAYENESKENEEKLEKAKENIEDLDAECENTRKELEKARNEEKENRKKELQEIIDEDLKKLEDILEKDKEMRESVDVVQRYMLWNEYISDEETKKLEGDFIPEWLLLEKEIKEFKVEGGLDFENDARIYINKLQIEVDANKEESFRLLDKDLKDLLIKREKEINEIKRRLVCAVEYSDYIYMLESKDDNYGMLNQELYEITETIEEYKNFRKGSYDKTLDRAKSDIHVAKELLEYDTFKRFKSERCNIIEKNKDLSIEEIFEELKKEYMSIMKFKETSAKRIMDSVKNRMEEFRKKMESEKNAEQDEEIKENPEILDDEEEQETPEIVEGKETEENSGTIETEEYYYTDDEEEYDDEETIEEEPTIIDTNEETDVHQNGGKFLKGVGKVRKKNI